MSLKIPVGGGMNNAADPSELDDDEAVEAVGWLHTRGGKQLTPKMGRTAFDSATTMAAAALGGVGYNEFSFPGATNRLTARTGTSFYAADAGLSGTFTAARTGMTDNPLGMWLTFANERYHYHDGVSTPWTYYWDKNNSVHTARATGLQPVQFTPSVTVQTGSGGSATVLLTAATTQHGSGTKNFSNANLFVDGNTTTAATVQLSNDGANAILRAGTFTGTGSGSRSDWFLVLTYEVAVDNNGRSTTKAEYTTNFTAGSPTWTQFELVNDAIGKHTVVQAISGNVDSATIGVRLTFTKKNDKGHAYCSAYDIRLQNSSGSGSLAATSGVVYWWTEIVDTEGIESASASVYVSPSTGTFSAASGTLVQAPPAITNSNATHLGLYRTADGGAYPVGTLVVRLSIRDESGNVTIPSSYLDTTNPATAASTTVYGVLTVAGISYERDIPPPISTVCETFQNMVVLAPVDEPNVIRYSAPGYPESFPLVNRIRLASSHDDTVTGLAVLGARLYVFMRGRVKRVDHLPTVTDPEFSVSPEELAPDHGLPSRNGLTYYTPTEGGAFQIGYVAPDGIRMTSGYEPIRLTDMINWRATVDVTRLSESVLRNVASESRLEFYFIPTSTFMASIGFTGAAANARMVMNLSYAEPGPFRVSIDPVAYHAVTTATINGRDYAFILSTDAPNTTGGIVYVDEVGISDAMHSYNATGTVPRRWRTKRFYGDDAENIRLRLRRLFVDHMDGTGTALVYVTAGDGIRVTSRTSPTLTFTHANESTPLMVNMSGQWFQFYYTHDALDADPQPLSGMSGEVELLGEYV